MNLRPAESVGFTSCKEKEIASYVCRSGNQMNVCMFECLTVYILGTWNQQPSWLLSSNEKPSWHERSLSISNCSLSLPQPNLIYGSSSVLFVYKKGLLLSSSSISHTTCIYSNVKLPANHTYDWRDMLYRKYPGMPRYSIQCVSLKLLQFRYSLKKKL